jgi:uncharacterized protein (TIGR02391 family)
MNYKIVAIEVGDLLKNDTTINQIDRIAKAIFPFNEEDFPNDSITSSRAKTIYNWILTLAKQKMEPSKRNELLIIFCRKIASEQHLERVNQLIKNAGIECNAIDRESNDEFISKCFHAEVIKHCKKLYINGHYFHSVFEACKVYNKAVQAKSKSTKDGYTLMQDVWGADNGVLKITACQTLTDKNVQNGVKFLSAGLMQAIRNPTAHEPALDWPINKQDCLDLLSFISFLFRQLDSAVYSQI